MKEYKITIVMNNGNDYVCFCNANNNLSADSLLLYVSHKAYEYLHSRGLDVLEVLSYNYELC